ncbi:4,5-DOPA dioxygenase extradiol [Ilumatobacter sp.]|uniref:4,5-DOPA-extradiol-dioxygenase n=1 Tax=Ilumatobacter sp. TaxID=1967498 RepID=UPI00345D81AA
MPALFVGHGSPTNALESNRYTDAWRELGRSIIAEAGTPRAILAISAHWYINAAAVTAMARPRTIHDFYGFSDELFAFEYPAPGDPDVAGEIVEVARPVWVGLDHDSWGLDHGTWSVLAHLFPDADVPVIQLSIDATKSVGEHLALATQLAPLREDGVLIVGSGNVVHNLRMLTWGRTDGFDWADRFDDAAREVVTERPGDVASLTSHDDFRMAAPTPDHFVPLLYTAGLAAAAGDRARVTSFSEGATMGSISMTSYRVDD